MHYTIEKKRMQNNVPPKYAIIFEIRPLLIQNVPFQSKKFINTVFILVANSFAYRRERGYVNDKRFDIRDDRY